MIDKIDIKELEQMAGGNSQTPDARTATAVACVTFSATVGVSTALCPTMKCTSQC